MDNKTKLNFTDDAARANWGGQWRMPTDAEWTELREKCTWTWTILNGIRGYKVKSKTNGNFIFLPAAGYRYDFDLHYVGDGGHYWSSSLNKDDPRYAWDVFFYSDRINRSNLYRCYGQSVRPVLFDREAEEKARIAEQEKLRIAEQEKLRIAEQEKLRIAEQEKKAAAAKKTIHAFHEYVDLGLPSGTKWATCNVGATNPEECGDRLRWGETYENTYFSWSTYKWCKGSETTLTKYCTNRSYGRVDNKTVLDLADDVAHCKWGGSWRMPTDAEWTELREKCTWNVATLNGIRGYKVKSKTNGNSIFLPDPCSLGDYWSSTLDTDNPSRAWGLSFSLGDFRTGRLSWVSRHNSVRSSDALVRPVFK